MKNLSEEFLRAGTFQIFVATVSYLCDDENCPWVDNLFLILLKEGDRESPAPPLMPLESETERNGFIIATSSVGFEIYAFLLDPQENICTLHLNTFKMTEDKSIKI